MKKVLMFQDYFYKGGIEKVILDIKNHLNNDYTIDILSMINLSDEKIITLLDKKHCNFFIRNFLGIRKYKKFLKDNHYDIIHIHCYNAFGLIYAFFAKKHCKKIIVHAHNSDIDKDFLHIKHMINGIIKTLFKRKKYIYIAVSAECNNFCFSNKNTIILPNGIDYDKYYFNKERRIKYRQEFNIKNNDIVIGHIGRFNEQKNHDFIIDIFSEINKIKNNYKLVLVGEGSLRKKIENKVNELNLNDKVIILNYRDDIPWFINMLDIYLSPSIFEGFGLTITENEINGKYVFISNKVPDSVIISNRLEIISLNKEANYWANKIINLKKKDLCLDNKLDINTYCKKLDDIYRGVYEKD